MPLDFLLLFATAFGLWWLAGRLIDDCLDQLESKYPWSRASAFEELGRGREGRP